MEVQHKLEIFMEKVLREAEDKRKDAEREIKEKYERVCAEIAEKAEKESNSRIKRERYNLEQLENKEISEAKARAKKKRALVIMELERKILDAVTKKTDAFRKTAEYEDYLVNGINKAVEEFGSDVTVYLCVSDMHLKEAVESRTHIAAKEYGLDFAGGFKISIAEGKMSVDNSFETRISEICSETAAARQAAYYGEAAING